MKSFTKGCAAALLAAIVAPALSTPATAQAIGGRRLPYTETLGISFYKVLPGHQDEWVELYKKWHRPLLEHDQKAGGNVTTATLYVRGAHMVSPDWDFAVVYRGPAPDKKLTKPLSLIRGEVIKKIFPDVNEYVAGEKRRWEITTAHWDDDFVELDLNEEHPGVFYPIVPKGK